jgi:VanZ family protein
MQNYLFNHFPWQLLMIIIFILSSLSNDRFPKIEFEWADKIIHFIVFGLLGFFLYRSFLASKRSFLNKNAIINSMIIGSLYGLSDEIHQSFVPGRFASLSDLIADTLGVCICVLIFHFYSSRVKNGS